MEWKESLGVKRPGWLSIGKHIADITHQRLDQQRRTACDLTNHLREVGNQYIEPEYVDDYLSGKVSFGCFFPQFREFLGIGATDVFRNVSEEEAQRNLQSLDSYLTDCANPESLVVFMLHKPGKELREHVTQLLRSKREETINRPYHKIELGLDREEDTNCYMNGRRQLRDFVRDSIGELVGERRLLPQDAQSLSPLKTLYDGIVDRMQQIHKACSWAYYATQVIPGSRLLIQPTTKNGRVGLTIEFLYPDGDYVDRVISECPLGAEDLKDQFVGIDAWKEAYTQGTFSTLTDPNSTGNMQRIANMMSFLQGGVDEFVPVRQISESERYEMHQRWVISTGGYYHAGPHIKGPQEVERMKNSRPDPLGRSEFEDTAYRMNSGLMIMLGLFDQLPQLVQDQPELELT